MGPRLKTKGWGPWRYDWYSICSRHYHHDEGCQLCRIGRWINRWRRWVGSCVYRSMPRLWRWVSRRGV